MGKVGKGHHAFEGVQELRILKKVLKISRANSHAPSKFRRKCGGSAFNGTCCGIVDDAVTSMSDFHGQLKILCERELLNSEKRSPYCVIGSHRPQNTVQSAFQKL